MNASESSLAGLWTDRRICILVVSMKSLQRPENTL